MPHIDSYRANIGSAAHTSEAAKVDGDVRLLKGGSSVGTSRFDALFNGAKQDVDDFVKRHGGASLANLLSLTPE